MAEKRLVLKIDASEAKKGAREAVKATSAAVKGADKATAAFQRLSNVLRTVTDRYREFSGALSGAQLNRFGRQLDQTSDHIRELSGRLDRLSDDLRQSGDSAGRADRQISGLSTSVRGLARRMGGLGSIMTGFSFGIMATDALRLADVYTGLANKISVVSHETENVTGAINDLVKVSQESRTSLDATVDVYQKLKRVQSKYNITQMELIKLTETVSKAVAMSGGTAQAQNAAILQFGQALSNNFKAASQELNSLNEQAPGLSLALAEGLTMLGKFGTVGVSDLKKLAENGLLNTKDALEALKLSAQSVDKAFATSTATLAQGWQMASDSLMVYLGQNEDFAKLTKGITDVLINFAKSLAGWHEEINSLMVGLAATGAVFVAFIAWWAIIPIAIATAITAMVSSIFFFRDELTDFFTNTIPSMFTITTEDVLGWLGGIPIGFREIADKTDKIIAEWASNFWADLKESFSGSKFEAIINIIKTMFLIIGNTILLGLAGISVKYEEAFDALGNVTKEKMNTMIAFVIDGWNKINSLTNEFLGFGGEVIEPFKFEIGGDNKALEATLGNLTSVKERLTELGVVMTGHKAALSDMIVLDREEAAAKKALADATDVAAESNLGFIVSASGLDGALSNTQKVLAGLKKGFADYAETAMDLTGNIASATERAMQGMEDAIMSFVTTGKASFSDLALSIINDLIKIQIQQSITGPLAGMLSTGISSFFGSTTGQTPGLGGTGLNQKAKGGAFDSSGTEFFAKGGIPGLSSFSGSVVSKPTMFAAGGSFNNVMGEAGPEAILPLTRTASGDLGVQTTGGGGGAVTNVIINNFGDDTVETKETKNQNGGVDIEVTIRKIVDNGIKNGAFDRSNKNRYGLSPRGA